MAVAAIPISIVMGTVGVGGFYFTKAKIDVFMERMNTVVAAVGSTQDDAAEAFARLREGGSEEFIKKASDENLTAWLAAIREKHGSLISAEKTPTSLQSGFSYQINAKFVNGSAPIIFRFSKLSGMKMLIDYIDVDGLALGQSP